MRNCELEKKQLSADFDKALNAASFRVAEGGEVHVPPMPSFIYSESILYMFQ